MVQGACPWGQTYQGRSNDGYSTSSTAVTVGDKVQARGLALLTFNCCVFPFHYGSSGCVLAAFCTLHGRFMFVSHTLSTFPPVLVNAKSSQLRHCYKCQRLVSHVLFYTLGEFEVPGEPIAMPPCLYVSSTSKHARMGLVVLSVGLLLPHGMLFACVGWEIDQVGIRQRSSSPYRHSRRL